MHEHVYTVYTADIDLFICEQCRLAAAVAARSRQFGIPMPIILRLKVRSHTKPCAIARTPVVPGYPATSNFNQLTIVNKYA